MDTVVYSSSNLHSDVAYNREYSSLYDTALRSWRYYRTNAEATTSCVTGWGPQLPYLRPHFLVYLTVDYHDPNYPIVLHWSSVFRTAQASTLFEFFTSSSVANVSRPLLNRLEPSTHVPASRPGINTAQDMKIHEAFSPTGLKDVNNDNRNKREWADFLNTDGGVDENDERYPSMGQTEIPTLAKDK